MDISTSDIVIALVSAIAGGAMALVGALLQRRRGRLVYSVVHSRVAVSADDAVFGSVKVNWQGQDISNLYASIITLTNRSVNDYENVKVRVFSSDAVLLNERSEIVGTTESLRYSPEFANAIHIQSGQSATPEQTRLFAERREYIVPTLNRDQVIRFSFLTSCKDASTTPSVWLEIIHKGILCRYEQIPNTPNEIWGVRIPTAALVGLLLTFAILLFTLMRFNQLTIVPIASFLAGALVTIPGVILIRLVRWARKVLL